MRVIAPAFLAVILSGTWLPGQETAPVKPGFSHWLETEQKWERDTNGPIISLGSDGDFDDRHIFAPTVAWWPPLENEVSGELSFALLYSGSRGSVKDRVFRLGSAWSSDGRRFRKADRNPVFDFGDAERRQSVLTPCLIRNAVGAIETMNGKAVLYFSATDFRDPSGRHTLHRTTSEDGINWSKPSPALLEGCYAPTLIRAGGRWMMWFTDVSETPWIFRYAESDDGLEWRVHPDPVMVLDQAWEKTNLFYPHVIKPSPESPYLMWYGSYLATNQHHTALGFAVSRDGITWQKHPKNPVFEPDPTRPWESHYVTSHSVGLLLNEGDFDFRIWYASRKAPPFENKYFAINTAVWRGVKDLIDRGQVPKEN